MNHHNRLRIVRAMKNVTLLSLLVVLGTSSAFAQVFTGPTQEFGLLYGGSKRLASSRDTAAGANTGSPGEPGQGPLTNTGFSFGNTVREVYYSIAIEPETRFKIKAGEIEGPVSFQVSRPNLLNGTDTFRHNYGDGKIQHLTGIIDYRFSEVFGSTGLFAGVGLYRQTHAGESSESSFGWVAGVNGDLPVTRHMGVVLEGAYHSAGFKYKAEVVTVTGGLRFSF